MKTCRFPTTPAQVLVDGVARDYRNPDGSLPRLGRVADRRSLPLPRDIEAGLVPELLGSFGDDHIAGGADHDVIFGQLGNDTIQGDGSIDSAVDDVAATLAAGGGREPDGSMIQLTPDPGRGMRSRSS